MADEPLPELGKPVKILPNCEFAQSGVYMLWLDSEIVYVGQASNVRKRIGTHLVEGVKNFDAVSVVPCELSRLDTLEAAFIAFLLPKYNRCVLSKALRRETGAILVSENIGRIKLSQEEAAVLLGMTLQDLWASGPEHMTFRSHKTRSRRRGYTLATLQAYAQQKAA